MCVAFDSVTALERVHAGLLRWFGEPADSDMRYRDLTLASGEVVRAPNSRVFRVDALCHEPDQRIKLMRHANELFRHFDVVMFSPSIIYGNSYDPVGDIPNHIKAMIWFYTGKTITPGQAAQQLHRCRQTLTIHVFCPADCEHATP